MPREIDGGEQKIADFGGGSFRVCIELGLDLVGLLADFSQHRARIVPVEADGAGFRLKFQRPGQGREPHRHAGKSALILGAAAVARAPCRAFSSRLDPLPQSLRRHSGVCECSSPKTCGWRRISFSVMAWTTSPKSKARCSSRHAGVEHDLEQEVAELVLEVGEIAARNGVGDLIGFFERVGDDGREILLPGPKGSRSPGVRSAAMISRSRPMSREGVMMRSCVSRADPITLCCHSRAERSEEPGIHNHHRCTSCTDRDYGFRTRRFAAFRNDAMITSATSGSPRTGTKCAVPCRR